MKEFAMKSIQLEMPPPVPLEFQPYVRLACAVVGSAVKEFFSKDEAKRDLAKQFLFGGSPGQKFIRTHWFTQAGIAVPSEVRLLAMMNEGKKRRQERAAARREAKKRRAGAVPLTVNVTMG
jgi:hypothetical protein